MRWWKCIDCGNKIPTESRQCSRCGYQRTEYDLAGAAEDTGEYLINRISYSALEGMFDTIGPSALKIIFAILIGVGVGAVVIVAMKFAF
jgi:hypothetical protein